MKEQCTEQELFEAMTDFVQSCHDNGHHDRDDNIDYFIRENRHMDVSPEDVEAMYDMIDTQY